MHNINEDKDEKDGFGLTIGRCKCNAMPEL